jgi:D-sedoheptulose 7-phosphate isomerase
MALAAADQRLLGALERVAQRTAAALRRGGRLLVCGNGGSAAQAIHFCGELVGPFLDRQRRGFAAIALGTDLSALTAIANDLGYEKVFARQVEALGRRGDVLWALTTSGRSPNVCEALRAARARGMWRVLFTNDHGGTARELADEALLTPKASTPRVQELHLAYGHWLCEAIEARLIDS